MQSTFQFMDEEIGAGKEIIILQAEMESIITSSMTKFDGEVIFYSIFRSLSLVTSLFFRVIMLLGHLKICCLVYFSGKKLM